MSGTFFFSTQGARVSNRLLGLLVLGLALLTLKILLCYSGYVRFVPFFVGLTEPLNFVVSPLHYLYTRSLATPAFRWRPRYLWLLPPAVAPAIYMVPFFAQSGGWKLRTVAESFHQPHPGAPVAMHNVWWFAIYRQFYPVFYLVLGTYLLLYPGAVLRLILRYRRQHAGQPIGPALGWLSRLGLGFGALLVYLGSTAYFHHATGDVNDAGDVWVGSVIALLFYGMSGNAIRRSSPLALPALAAATVSYSAVTAAACAAAISPAARTVSFSVKWAVTRPHITNWSYLN